MKTTPKEQAKPPFDIMVIDLIDAYHYADFFEEKRSVRIGCEGYIFGDYDSSVSLADRLFWALNPDAKTQQEWYRYDMGYDVRIYDANHNCVYKAHEKLPEE